MAPSSAPGLKTVLFVDDETRVLYGLKRALRGMRAEWQMEFVDDPRRAVDMLRERNFDALVTDMRMPHLDGSEVLAFARDLRPGMARIVLSGFSEHDAAVRSVGLAHQFLAKPCEASMLRTALERSCGLRNLMTDPSLVSVVGRLGQLPSLPKLYHALNEEMGLAEVSLKRVAAIISQDISMTAKILQIVNSAFFGLGRRVLDIEQAVNCLGVETLRSLVVSNAAFSSFEEADERLIEELWLHSTLTGLVAKRLAELELESPAVHVEALQAGMLHDIGQLVLAGRLAAEYAPLIDAGAASDSTLSRRERAVLRCDHGGIGAYLMGLWGLTDGIVEALAFHHFPRDCGARQVGLAAIVHAADALVQEQLKSAAEHDDLDLDYIAELGCAQRLELWRAEAGKVVVAYTESRP